VAVTGVEVTGLDYRGRMKRIALAGGIGAGKTAAADRLVALGYRVIDADVVAHQVTANGTPAWRALRDAFGDAVLAPDGSLDRAFVAEIVFHDTTALRRLNRITHGHIGVEIGRRLDDAAGAACFVALPLFRPEHRAAFHLDEAWAVLVGPDIAMKRLCELRGFSEADASARLASQMSNEERMAIVDRVIWNEGSLDDLCARVDEALRESGVTSG
jgi:dephospho-CoA kinase